MGQENHSSEFKDMAPASRVEITLNLGQLSLSQSELCEIYHQVPQVLLKNAIKVTITENKPIQYPGSYEVFIADERNGNYWVITAEDRTQWLFPKVNFKINTYNLDRVKSLFECQGDKPENTREFSVKKPARLSIIAVGSQWTLEEKGILEFGNNSILSKLKSELEQEKEECERLQSQLKPLMQERTEIQSQLDRSKSERSLLIAQVQQLNQDRSRLLLELERADKREQDILFQLITRDEFQKQMQQATKERKLLLSIIKELKRHIQLSNKAPQTLFISPLSASKEINSTPQITQPFGIRQQTPTNNINKLSLFEIPYLFAPQDHQQENSQAKPIPRIFSSSKEEELLKCYEELLKCYNEEPQIFSEKSVEVVSETGDSVNQRRLGTSKTILEKNRRGNYWILTESGCQYLVPKWNFKINEYSEYSYNTLQALFICFDYQAGISRNFQLVKPAKVSIITGLEKWQLEEHGILQFLV